jgi:hypothetical protein
MPEDQPIDPALVAQTFRLLNHRQFKMRRVYMSLDLLRDLRGELPWKPEEIPPGSIVMMHDGELSLVQAEDGI